MFDTMATQTMGHLRTLWDAYREGSQFFMREGDIFETLRRLAQRLQDESLDYTLEKLIELKLASGLSAPHCLKDLADVQGLIMRLRLPLNVVAKLDASVQAEYRRLWESAQAANNEQG